MASNNSLSLTRRDVLIFAFVVIMVYMLSRAIRLYQRQKAYDAIAGDANAQIAFLIRQACNPKGALLGFPLIDVDGTDEEKLFALAVQIKDLNAVRNAYQKQFGEELLDRLRDELQGDFEKWMSLVNSNGGGTNPIPVDPDKPRYVQAATNVNVLNYNDSSKVERSYTAGQTVGRYLSERDFKHSDGKMYRYVVVTYKYGWFDLFEAKGYVLKSAIRITNYV
ncbi:hypothetical protein [Runella sp.]|uniref:hypothetical protein n=1 Tax=Runella sp. TaxID=1960881 RepID=UPI003D0BBC55